MGRWISFGYLVDVRKLQKLDRVNLSAYTPPMTDTARNIEHLDPASTDGLADFFTSAEQTLITDRGDSDQTMIIEQGDPDQSPITTLINPDHWTLQETAERLSLSLVTVRRRLQKGSLKGHKVQGLNGPEWRIEPPEQTLITDRGDSDQTMIIEQGDTDQTPITTLITPDHQVVTALLARITEVESKLSDAQNALQSANWRNGYLESQLESQRDQIKLLTDSQHKPGWWQRFKQIWQKH